MRLILVTMGFIAMAAPALRAVGQVDPTPQSLAKIVAPFVDQQTLAVVHVDLLSFDAPRAIDMLAQLAQLPDRERDNLQAELTPISVVAQALPPGTAGNVFAVVSLADLARLPFFLVLPLDEIPAKAIAVEARRAIEKNSQRRVIVERIGEALVVGSPETIERLKKSQPAARPEIVEAFRSTADGSLHLAFVPSAGLRTILDPVVAQLAPQIGGGQAKILTQGVVWAAAGIRLPPDKVAVRVVLQSANADAAAALERQLAELAKVIGQLPGVAAAVPQFDELSKHFLPKACGDRLQLELSEENGGIAALQSLLPLLRTLALTRASEQP